MNNQKINFPPVLIDGKPASPKQLERLKQDAKETWTRENLESPPAEVEMLDEFERAELAELSPEEQAKNNARVMLEIMATQFSPEDLEQWQGKFKTGTPLNDFVREWNKRQGALVTAHLNQMTRRGQMIREEWHAPVSWIAGSEALLCELSPGFDLAALKKLGDYERAAFNAVLAASKDPKHPKAARLKEAIAEGHRERVKNKISHYWPCLCRCDEVLGATEKWRVSTFEKLGFDEKYPDGYTLGKYREFVQAKRRVWAREAKRQEPKLDSITPEEIAIWTSQETDAYTQSASHGLSNANWRNEITSDRRVWEHAGYHFRVEIDRKTALDAEPLDWEQLEKLTGDQNTDFALAFFYVASCLSPAPGSNKAKLLTGKIDLNDLMLKIGWLAQKPDEATREQLREKIWRYLVYGEEAVLIGARSIPYFDKVTKKEIPTRMESAAWKIIDRQRPEGKPGAAPLWVEVVIGRQWEAVFSNPHLAQFLPLGELLGAIPPNKVGGAWARAMGLTLAKFWRCKPKETISKTLKISRREILTHFAPTPKIQTVEQLLSSDKPKRAVAYYREALQILLESGLIAPEGDAAPGVTPSTMLKPYGRQGWGEKWLSDACNLHPGPKWEPPIKEIADASPTKKPRNLAANAKRRKPKTG